MNKRMMWMLVITAVVFGGLFGMKWFQTEDPVSRAKLIDWQKLSLYSGVVFLIVTLGSVMIASAKSD